MVKISDELWGKLKELSLEKSRAKGRHVSISELLEEIFEEWGGQ
jgi:hypothetical protein